APKDSVRHRVTVRAVGAGNSGGGGGGRSGGRDSREVERVDDYADSDRPVELSEVRVAQTSGARSPGTEAEEEGRRQVFAGEGNTSACLPDDQGLRCGSL